MFEMEKIKREFEITGFHSIYSFEFGKDFSHVPEKHDFWEMVYVDAGRIRAITNGVGCTLEQGQAIFHELMDIHVFITFQEHLKTVSDFLQRNTQKQLCYKKSHKVARKGSFVRFLFIYLLV